MNYQVKTILFLPIGLIGGITYIYKDKTYNKSETELLKAVACIIR